MGEKTVVERHPKGWAVVKKNITGCHINWKTVLTIQKTKLEAERAAYAHKQGSQ